MLHIELYQTERKGRYVKDDTAIKRPDDRTPDGTPDETRDERAGGQKDLKRSKKVLTHNESMIY